MDEAVEVDSAAIVAGREPADMFEASEASLDLTGEPVDIGLALLYLASDASRFVTCHLLRVSGGA